MGGEVRLGDARGCSEAAERTQGGCECRVGASARWVRVHGGCECRVGVGGAARQGACAARMAR